MSQTIPKLLKEQAVKAVGYNAQLWKDASDAFQPTTFAELMRQVNTFAAGLASLGVKRSDRVGLISENRREWLIADLSIMSLGAADVPRGCDTLAPEMAYILGFSGCKIVIFEDDVQLAKSLDHLKDLPDFSVAVMFDTTHKDGDSTGRIKIRTFKGVMDDGLKFLEKDPDYVTAEIEKGDEHDVATLIFTSGTTGRPKGVMLSHRNFLHQVDHVPELIHVGPGDIWLCVLPVWHSFERIMQYIALGTGSTLAYSKPIGKIMLADMAKVKPTWMASVPRIWESVKAGVYRNIKHESAVKRGLFHFFVAVGGAHAQLRYLITGSLPRFRKRVRFLDFLAGILPIILLTPFKLLGDVLVFKKIKAKLGGKFVAGVSGGGALPAAVDKFFAAAGILLLEGYGLTETAPVLGVRKQDKPVPGTIGPVFPGTEIKIVGENGRILPPGHKGVVYARGPQIMKGYYKNEEATRKVLDDQGWLNTGDLGMLTWDNELKIVGREKDTIVLLGGENIEPYPIEQKLTESEFIFQAMVVGQDQKFLGALIVPDLENIRQYAEENKIIFKDPDELIGMTEINSLLNNEIQTLINRKNGFRPFEQISRFYILQKPFEIGRELSQKQEIKRHVIGDMYKTEIKNLFK